jgi:hypothetical protein
VALTTHPHLVPWSRKSRAIHLLPLWDRVACYRVKPNHVLKFCLKAVKNHYFSSNALSPEVLLGNRKFPLKSIDSCYGRNKYFLLTFRQLTCITFTHVFVLELITFLLILYVEHHNHNAARISGYTWKSKRSRNPDCWELQII